MIFLKQFFKNQFLVALIAYIVIIGLATIVVVGFLQKIKLANEKNREQLKIYQNLKIVDNRFGLSSQKVSCDGNLFFQAKVPVTAIHSDKGRLYLSQTDNKMIIIDLSSSKQPEIFNTPVLTDFYTDATDIYGTDFLNNQVVRLVFSDEKLTVEKVYPKIGHPSALTRGPNKYFYVSGYASGIITKIIGRDGFLFLSGLEKVVSLAMNGEKQLLVARYDIKPTLISIDLNDNKQNIIEQKDDVSSLTYNDNSFWVAYNHNGQSQLGIIIDGKLENIQKINCPFPLKIAVWQDKIFYYSLMDKEGKVYWINKNFQKNGK